VKETWVVVEEMDYPRLCKLSLPSVGEPVDLYVCKHSLYITSQFIWLFESTRVFELCILIIHAIIGIYSIETQINDTPLMLCWHVNQNPLSSLSCAALLCAINLLLCRLCW